MLLAGMVRFELTVEDIPEQSFVNRRGQRLATVPEDPKNRYGRPLLQGLQYSDTPVQPLVEMRFTDTQAEPGKAHRYRVIAVNTAGLSSE